MKNFQFCERDFRTVAKDKTPVISFIDFRQVFPTQLCHITFKAIFIKSSILDVWLGVERLSL